MMLLRFLCCFSIFHTFQYSMKLCDIFSSGFMHAYTKPIWTRLADGKYEPMFSRVVESFKCSSYVRNGVDESFWLVSIYFLPKADISECTSVTIEIVSITYCTTSSGWSNDFVRIYCITFSVVSPSSIWRPLYGMSRPDNITHFYKYA